ncbi:MAG: hypothetical protein JWR39_2565, partial [Devosia sp.]|nr:hypothetical protein [Devosia sp.]
MRKLTAAVLVAGATVIAGPALAADFPEYPPVIEIPDVDYGVQGSFYLRGSAAGNALWTREAYGIDCVVCGVTPEEETFPVEEAGYGYSVGAGVGFETGTGLRFDATVDHVSNDGLVATGDAGDYTLALRSTIALANAYYDFSLGGDGFGYNAAGGAFGYVGVGAGAAFNESSIEASNGFPVPSGENTSFAAAGMVGVGYDFGAIVADVGYRGIYINELNNSADFPANVRSENNWLHEV